MEKPIHTGNFQRRKGRDQYYLVFPGVYLENPRRESSCDPSCFCFVGCGLAGGSGVGAGGGCTSRPCEVRSLDSLQMSPQETSAGSWAWRRFYLPAGVFPSHSISAGGLELLLPAVHPQQGALGQRLPIQWELCKPLAAPRTPPVPHPQGRSGPRSCTGPGERPASGSWLRHRKSSCQEDSSVFAHPYPPAPFFFLVRVCVSDSADPAGQPLPASSCQTPQPRAAPRHEPPATGPTYIHPP